MELLVAEGIATFKRYITGRRRQGRVLRGNARPNFADETAIDKLM